MIVILSIFLVLLAAAGGIALSMQLTPRTFVAFLRHSGIFEGKPEVPEAIAAKADQVSVVKDIVYPSVYDSNMLDIYYPSDGSVAKATIFWVHGGGFISGDKSGLAPFAMALVQAGYAVVSINYALAPETAYPAPVVQLGEAYRFILQNAKEYPGLPLDKLVFGGDSAGAQIASQFAALQCNEQLQGKMNRAPMIAPENMKAVVLYCGPYNLKGFDNVEDGFMKLFVQQIGWAYLGEKNWRATDAAAQVSTIDFITADYPPTFITDGNAFSFEEQGRELLSALRQKGVFARGLFYDDTEITLPHEYQFDYQKHPAQAQECLEQTLSFLEAALQGAKR